MGQYCQRHDLEPALWTKRSTALDHVRACAHTSDAAKMGKSPSVRNLAER